MSIYLVVGQPRHGKSQFCAKLAYDYHLKNIAIQKKIDSGKYNPEIDIVREIYSDIDGHATMCDFIKSAPEDWRDVPNDSIIFMDEIHQRPAYCDSTGKMSNDPMIVDLTTHGHQNKDIILITQDPERLNRGIRKLVEKMYLVKRPMQKPPFATIYEFERWLRDPWQAVKRPENYQDSYKFPYKKKWQDMYKSASAHTSMSFKIQRKFIFASIVAVLLFGGAYTLFTKSGGDKLARQATAGLTGKQVTTDNSYLSSDKNNNSISLKDDDCLKGENVDLPQCKEFYKNFSERSQNLNNPNYSDTRTQTVSYNASNPYDLKTIDSNLTYEVTSKPLFSGCAKFNGKYIAYTQQGTILHDVSAKDCKRLIDDNDRPFNYFKSENQNVNVSNQGSSSDVVQQDTKQVSTLSNSQDLHYRAVIEEQAKQRNKELLEREKLNVIASSDDTRQI